MLDDRVHPRGDERRDEPDQLVAGESVLVLLGVDQAAQQVLPRALAATLDELAEHRDARGDRLVERGLLRVREAGVRPPEEGGAELVEFLVQPGRDVEGMAHHRHRDPRGVVADEVEAAPGIRLREELSDDALDLGAELLRRPRRERAVHEAADPGMVLREEAEEHLVQEALVNRLLVLGLVPAVLPQRGIGAEPRLSQDGEHVRVAGEDPGGALGPEVSRESLAHRTERRMRIPLVVRSERIEVELRPGRERALSRSRGSWVTWLAASGNVTKETV